MPGKTPQWAQIKAITNAEFASLRTDHLDPWNGFGGRGCRIRMHNGRMIDGKHITLSDVAIQIFWREFIGPYLDDTITACVVKTAELADKIGTRREPLLEDVLLAIESGIRGTFWAMRRIHESKNRGFDPVPDIEPMMDRANQFAREVAGGWANGANVGGVEGVEGVEGGAEPAGEHSDANDPEWRQSRWFSDRGFPVGKVRQATLGKRKTKRVRKLVDQSGVLYSRRDVRKNWPEEYAMAQARGRDKGLSDNG